MINKQQIFVLLAAISLMILLAAFMNANPYTNDYMPDSQDLVYNTDLYLNDEDGSIKYFYITVKEGGNYTFADVKSDRYDHDGFEPVVDVLFQEGDSEGPSAGYYGFGLSDINGTIEIRGATSRFASQKSFKIRLDPRKSAWNGLWTINLNKHPFDLTRVRNKLSFDYMEIIPHINSLRTQFVHLFIKDLSGDVPAANFVDYGLFTLVEQPNNLFLRVRGLDIDAHLYKAEFFEFHRYPDHLKNQYDPEYNEDMFQQILGIRGNPDHRKLLSMLDDVNNLNLDINRVIAEHFNHDNLLTWLAVNILLENVDTRTQNYFLYSPLDSNTWYFLPWDYDGAWGFYEQAGIDRQEWLAPWENGISNYWGVVLFRRFFQDAGNVQALLEKMELLLDTLITSEQTRSFLNSYHPVVSRLVNRWPDSEYFDVEYFEQEFWRIADEPKINFYEFHQNLENPMPVFLGLPSYDREELVFRWTESYDLQGDLLSYNFQISKSPDFTDILFEQSGLVKSEIMITPLPAGVYYWRVLIRDNQGNEQTAFDIYTSEDKVRFFGVRRFEVN